MDIRGPRTFIADAVHGNLGPTYRDHRAGEIRDPMPRYPSGITEVQHRARGFYGFTVIQGESKVGKSLIAQRSSVEAAAEGWHVVYCYGEMTAKQIDERLSNVLGVPGPDHWPTWMYERWHGVHFGERAHIDELLLRAADKIPLQSDRALIVIDSMQALAEEMADENDLSFYRALDRIKKLGHRMAENSNGRVGVIGMSETNKNGGTKGGNFDYKVGVLLKMFRGKNDSKVDLYMLSRETPGGELGSHVRVYNECRFVSEAAWNGTSERGEVEPELEQIDMELPF